MDVTRTPCKSSPLFVPQFSLDEPARAAPATPSKGPRSKIYCNAIPAFIGPWRAKIRAWPQVLEGRPQWQRTAQICGSVLVA